MKSQLREILGCSRLRLTRELPEPNDRAVLIEHRHGGDEDGTAVVVAMSVTSAEMQTCARCRLKVADGKTGGASQLCVRCLGVLSSPWDNDEATLYS